MNERERDGLFLRVALWALAAIGVALALPDRTRADTHLVRVAGEPEGVAAARAERWRARIVRALEREGDVIIEDESVRWSYGPEATEASRVDRLAHVEGLIRQAHEARERLDLRAALGLLREAEREALGLLDVPSANAWYAEVQVALAVTAAEIDEPLLAEAALYRATSVDSTRALRAAEAPPALIARAQSIARAMAMGPEGRFEFRSRTEGASVWMDGRPLGAAPVQVRAGVGAHILRVEAPGHRTWARLVDVFEGARAPIEVTLSPEPELAAARSLLDACREPELDRVTNALAVLERREHAPTMVWLVEVSDGPIDRALLSACRSSGCSRPSRLSLDGTEVTLATHLSAPIENAHPAEWFEARAWLDEAIAVVPPAPATPLWEEPWPWLVAGALVLGGTALGIGLSWPQPTNREHVIIDTSEAWQ